MSNLKLLKKLFVPILLTFLLQVNTSKAQNYIDTTIVDTVEQYEDEIVAPPSENGQLNEEAEEENSPNLEPSEVYISPDSIQWIKRQPAFAYMSYLDSMLRAEQRIKDKQPPPKPAPEPKLQPSLWDNAVVKFLCWALAIGLVGFVLYKLFFSQGIFVRNRQEAVQDVTLGEVPNETDLEKGLRQAIAQKDYRLGVRYLFLITLSKLGEKGAVQLAAEKTNHQYANELTGKTYANDFARLSLQYEYVWFGNFQISETQFNTIQQQHQQFLKQV